MKENTKIIFLGGVSEIGKNITAIEYDDEIIVVDSGIAFPSADMPGIDSIIPDISYLKENAHKVKALILTHGHEDHIGSVPYFLKEINVPVFGTKLTLTLTENKLKEHKLQNTKLNCVKEGTSLKMGVFGIEFLKVSHSICGSLALSITTPAGVIFFTGDFKIDYTPIDNQLMDFHRFAEIGKRGVTALLCDSTNVEREGYTMSESTIGEKFEELFEEHKDKRLFIATFASNVHRLQQVFDVAKMFGRKVALSGRSMLNVVDSARRIGELNIAENILIDLDKIGNYKDQELVIICTGTQGEPMSALTRIASDENAKIKIGENDLIILSASPIPGNEKLIYNVINNLYNKGAKVIYNELEKVHVSGHACKEELKLMHSLLKPKFFIPVHGEARHLILHKDLAMSMGMQEKDILIPELGDVVEVTKRSIKHTEKIKAGSLLVDGMGIEDIDSLVLRDRKHLAEDGVLVVAMAVNEESGEVALPIDIISRGLIASNKDITGDIKKIAAESLIKYDLKNESERIAAQKTICRDVRNYIYKKVKSSPMIIPVMSFYHDEDTRFYIPPKN